MTTKDKHYVSNKEFLQEFVEYKANVREAEAAGLPKPRLPNCIGEKIMLIAHRLAHKPNFINYSYRDEMVDDAIENCVMYADNFDPDKGGNPFSYFTQICYFAFIRRIKREKQHFLTKVKYVQRSGDFLSESSRQGHDYGENFDNSYRDFLRQFYDVELEEETAKPTRKKRASDEDSIRILDLIGDEEANEEK